MDNILKTILDILIMMVPFLLSLTIHESAHAWVANRRGDPTARLMGRISMNPFAHADLIGTIIFPILGASSGFMFGWAKPVPVNPINLKSYRKDIFWISLAGPLSNFILAFLFTLIFVLLIRFKSLMPLGVFMPLFKMANVGILINLALCFFNLIPLGPLDGAKILGRFLPEHIATTLEQFSTQGMIILLILMFFGMIGNIIGPPIRFFGELFKNIAIQILLT